MGDYPTRATPSGTVNFQDGSLGQVESYGEAAPRVAISRSGEVVAEME